MARRKLRNCSKCGIRHGPPIGTRCKRAEDEFRRLNEEMDKTLEAGRDGETVNNTATAEKSAAESTITKSGEEEKMVNSTQHQDSIPDGDLPSFSEFRRQREAERETSHMPEAADSGERGHSHVTGDSQQGFYYQVPWQFVPPHLRGRLSPRTMKVLERGPAK